VAETDETVKADTETLTKIIEALREQVHALGVYSGRRSQGEYPYKEAFWVDRASQRLVLAVGNLAVARTTREGKRGW